MIGIFAKEVQGMEILISGLGNKRHNLTLDLMDHTWTVCGYDVCSSP